MTQQAREKGFYHEREREYWHLRKGPQGQGTKKVGLEPGWRKLLS